MALNHFLIVYDVRQGRLLSLADFGHDVERATDAYAEAEREYRDREDHEDFEIVLVGADSLDTIETTHSRYFRDEELVPFGH